ncbi:pentatricopeptide repeat-containing protein At1g18900-like isoform X1 [Macadamia integrifolia]|uniref:pentatricopeptide repeat-containing protein At1g18900-like isoform X1 n=2 Tax=Macadamia integrifolia TaxID=60698 RepID=UPI001C4E8E3E|nr:pentatricopeptide repeat-containing protein At1g18900-like isoform X1 [Macadamia integrifolia]
MQTMLRTKQLGTFSHCARTFFLSGSRCSTADGSSCVCTEDETCVSRKQQRSNEVLLPQKTPEQAQSPLSGDAVGTVGHHRAESGVYRAPVPHIPPTPASSARFGDANYVSGNVIDAQKNLVPTSTLVSDHFVKAGIAAVSFLYDLANYKLPTSDGSGALLLPQNCMVDSTRPISNVRSSNGKPHKSGYSKSHGKPSVDVARGSHSTAHYNGSKGKAEKPGTGTEKGFDRVSSTAARNSVNTHGLASDSTDGRQSIPQRQGDSYHFVAKSKAKGRTSEGKVFGGISEGIKSVDRVQKPQRCAKMPTGTTSMSRQSVNAGQAVDRANHILQQMKWGPAAEQALGNLCSFNAYQANQILKQLQDHSVAQNFFYWLKHQPGFKHDEHSYTTMVGVLGRARQFSAINKLLDEMVRDGCRPNVVTYNRLIHSYGRANYMGEAINVFYQMQKAGCKPDRVTYCTLIDIHAKAGFLDVAMDMYQRMQEVGLSPDTFTYSVIINCLGKAGHLAAAYKLFCEMIAHGCVPNLVTYNIMIALQAKARNYPSALKLYRDMQTAGFRPDKVTYSIVMEVLGHCGYLDEAEAVFAEMKLNNWAPDEPVYGLLVDLWGKAGNVDKARGWYLAMLNDGLRPNVPTCNSLLSAFLRVFRFSDAHDVLLSMMRLGLQPSLQTYTLLLSFCTETQSPLEMGFCCKLMAITGHPAHGFLQSLPAAEPDGKNVRAHASYFLDLMHSEDRESKRGLVDAVIDFLHKSGLKEEAGSVWEVAAQKNVYPDAVREKRSCYWLINLHVMSDGTAVTALSRTLAWFRRQMLASGIGPNRIDIVTGWGRRSRVTGSSLVRQTVEELLHMFQFPFFTENGNSGCFVGCGEPLGRWLLHPYVERMHLL